MAGSGLVSSADPESSTAVTPVRQDSWRRRLGPWQHDYLLLRQMQGAYQGLIARHLSERRKMTVVDYGCGSMPYRALLAGVSGRYLGVDFAGNGKAELLLDEAGAVPLPEGSADLVVSAQVLEHVADVKFYLAECHRLLRPGGMLLLSTHGSWIYHPHPLDVQRWTRTGLESELERAGFSVIDRDACLGPLAYSTQLRLLLVQGLLGKLGLLGRMVGLPLCMIAQGWMALEDWVTPHDVRRDNACVFVMLARRCATSG